MATSFPSHYQIGAATCFYAAGLSSSRCNDLKEFARESAKLQSVIAHNHSAEAFGYFGACSVADTSIDTRCARHWLQLGNDNLLRGLVLNAMPLLEYAFKR